MRNQIQNKPTSAGPFDLGLQGYLVIAIIVLATAVFAATRSDWVSMIFAAIIPPLILFPLIALLARAGRRETSALSDRREQGIDVMTFLARTNPLMFLLFGSVARRTDEERYQELLRAGPYGMGMAGYVFFLLIILCPLVLAIVVMLLTGRPPGHSGLHL